MQSEQFGERPRTLPELPRRSMPSAVRRQLALHDPTSALRSLQLARLASEQQQAVPRQATMGSLATMLMACSYLQVTPALHQYRLLVMHTDHIFVWSSLQLCLHHGRLQYSTLR